MIMSVTQTAMHMAPPPRAAEIDLELFTFVERYATTNFRLDLILWFGRNPDAELTADELATALRRNAAVTTKELDDLTYLRVLVRRYTPEQTTYRLTKRANVRQVAMRLAALEAMPLQVAA